MNRQKAASLTGRNIIADLSSARTFLMGFSILWVILFHLTERFYVIGEQFSPAVNAFARIGYGGCDVFLFLSGFGLTFSLAKAPGFANYMGRRAARIFPSYYPFILLFCTYGVLTQGFTLPQIAGNLTFLGAFWGMENQFNWYISASMLFYLLAPAVDWLIRQAGSRGKAAAALISVTLLIQIVFYDQFIMMIIVTRLPVFLLGYYFGTCDREKMNWTWGKLAGASAALILGLWFMDWAQPWTTWSNGLLWYPFLLIAPGICLLAAAVRPWLLACKPLAWLDRGICLLGGCSLEIYFVHLMVFERVIPSMPGKNNWYLVAVLCIGLGIGYHYAVEYAMKRIRKNRTA